jgi:hypothetical protein
MLLDRLQPTREHPERQQGATMIQFKDCNIVLVASDQLSRANILAKLGVDPASPDGDKWLDDVERMINQELLYIGPAACKFELSAGPSKGWLALKSIDPDRFDELVGKMPELLPEKKAERAVFEAVRKVHDGAG